MNVHNWARDPLPVVIKIGICRDPDCEQKGELGLLGSRCRGIKPYPTRSKVHTYLPLRSDNEKKKCNNTNLSEYIGVCHYGNCFAIGNLDMECLLCRSKSVFSTHEDIRYQTMLNPMVAFYASGSRERNLIPIRQVISNLPDVESDSNEDESLSNLSFYTPDVDEVEEENMENLDLFFYNDDGNVETVQELIERGVERPWVRTR